MTVSIPLSKDMFATVDDDWFDFLMQFRWNAYLHHHIWYAVTYLKKHGGTTNAVSMHRVITCANPSQVVDHIDGNGLNNISSNLRLCSANQNKANGVGRRNRRFRYKGVDNNGNRINPWSAYIRTSGAKKHLGVFQAEEDAARAYNVAALAQYGEFARLNDVS